MTFELVPILDKMLELYQKPANMERFNAYLRLLVGNTDNNLEIPIGAFNPMAKEHVSKKLNELKELKAEQVAHENLTRLNKTIATTNGLVNFKVFLCLSDDLKGSWTERYTSDYNSKFKLNPLIKRNFCTPIFWSSEDYSSDLIIERTLQYAYRTIHLLDHSSPRTLKEHIEQEKFVAARLQPKNKIFNSQDFELMNTFYEKHHSTEEYSIIFNFLYGDKTCKALEYPCYGVSGEMAGYEFAQFI